MNKELERLYLLILKYGYRIEKVTPRFDYFLIRLDDQLGTHRPVIKLAPMIILGYE